MSLTVNARSAARSRLTDGPVLDTEAKEQDFLRRRRHLRALHRELDDAASSAEEPYAEWTDCTIPLQEAVRLAGRKVDAVPPLLPQALRDAVQAAEARDAEALRCALRRSLGIVTAEQCALGVWPDPGMRGGVNAREAIRLAGPLLAAVASGELPSVAAAQEALHAMRLAAPWLGVHVPNS